MIACKKKQQQNEVKYEIIFDTSQEEHWNEANIDSQISKNIVYPELDKQVEILSAFESKKKYHRRSSIVNYYTTGTNKINLKDDDAKEMNNCRAFYFKPDTLSINIGISNGFVGWGFTIFYKDKKYYTQPYYFTDQETISELEPRYKVVYQKLVLNKANYKVGDSVYGKIDFKSIEITIDKKKFEHIGKGYFRSKIEKI